MKKILIYPILVLLILTLISGLTWNEALTSIETYDTCDSGVIDQTNWTNHTSAWVFPQGNNFVLKHHNADSSSCIYATRPAQITNDNVTTIQVNVSEDGNNLAWIGWTNYTKIDAGFDGWQLVTGANVIYHSLAEVNSRFVYVDSGTIKEYGLVNNGIASNQTVWVTISMDFDDDNITMWVDGIHNDTKTIGNISVDIFGKNMYPFVCQHSGGASQSNVFLSGVNLTVNETVPDTNIVDAPIVIRVFNNSLEIENLTFSGNENITRYLEIPLFAQNITKAYVNLTGYEKGLNDTFCYQETTNNSNVKDGSCGLNFSGTYNNPPDPFTNWENLFDGNWNTYATGDGASIGDIDYIKPPSASDASIWQVKDGTGTFNLSIPSSCWNYYTDNLSFRVISNDAFGDTWWYCDKGSWELIKTSSSTLVVYEEAMFWTNKSSYPENPYLELNGTQIWSFNSDAVCYQEHVNVSTSCGGLSTGEYNISGTWFNNDGRIVDGLWVDYDYCNSGYCYLYSNYTKPTDPVNVTWQVYYGGSGGSVMDNYTITDTCFEQDPIELQVESRNDVSPNEWTKLYCRNSTDWELLHTSLVGRYWLYEEAVFWGMSLGYNTSNQTSNFGGNISEALNNGNCLCSGCSTSGDSCFIPFTFHSDSAGYLQYSWLQIGYTPYANIIYTNRTVESTSNVFSINLANIEGLTENMIMTYNNTNYNYNTKTYLSSIGAYEFNFSITSPPTSVNSTDILFNYTYNYTYSNGTIYNINTTETYTQEVHQVLIDNCSTNNILSLNYTVRDEDDEGLLNATMDMSYTVVASGETFDIIYDNHTYGAVCIYPEWGDIETNYEVFYSTSGYPQRRYYENNDFLSNVSQNITLYLLGTADGIYVRFKTIDAYQNVISGVNIVMRDIDTGNPMEQENTDDAGLATFWVNPDTDYNFTFTRTGYLVNSFILRPTSSEIYNVQMVEESTPTTYSMYSGIEYQFYPTTSTLTNATFYNFTFNLSSSYWDITDCTLNIMNITGTVLSTSSSTFNTTECSITIEFNTNDYSTLRLEGEYQGNSTYNITYRKTYNIGYIGQFSLWEFLTNDLRNFTAGGFSKFTLMFIAFIVIFGITIAANKFVGLTNPEGIIGLIWGLVLLFSYVNWLSMDFDFIPDIYNLQQYLIFYMITLLGISIILKRLR